MRKLSNRVKGDERAEIGLKKEDVQIDEVSKATLMRYIPAASRAAAQHVYTGKEAQTWAGHAMRANDYASSEHQLGIHKKEMGKSIKRLKGIDTATKKLGTKKTYEEFVQGLEEAAHVYDTKTGEVHSVHKTYNKAVKAAEKMNKDDKGYDTPGNLVRDKWGVRAGTGLKEEVEQIEEATVASRKYDWGTMKTVHHGKSFSIPLHPEHHQPIAKLKHGESHSFKDETGRKWKATREHDTVHFHGGSYGTQKTSVPHEKLQESLEEKHSHEVIPGTQVKPNLTRVKTASKVLKKEEVAESRGHKVLATFFKNREIAQRAAQGDKQTPKYLEKGIETPEKDAVEKKKMLGLKEDQYAADYKIKYYVDPITGENKTRKIRPHRVDFAASKMRAEPAQKDAQGDYGIKEGFLTPSIEADMKNLSAYEYLKKYGKHKSQHRQSLKTRPEDLKEGGFDNYDEIAKELIRRHGKNVDTGHIHDIEGERDTHRGLDHAEVMAHVKKHLKEEDPFPRDEKWTELKPKHIKGAK